MNGIFIAQGYTVLHTLTVSPPRGGLFRDVVIHEVIHEVKTDMNVCQFFGKLTASFSFVYVDIDSLLFDSLFFIA